MKIDKTKRYLRKKVKYNGKRVKVVDLFEPLDISDKCSITNSCGYQNVSFILNGTLISIGTRKWDFNGYVGLNIYGRDNKLLISETRLKFEDVKEYLVNVCKKVCDEITIPKFSNYIIRKHKFGWITGADYEGDIKFIYVKNTEVSLFINFYPMSYNDVSISCNFINDERFEVLEGTSDEMLEKLKEIL